jgi:hypothetical protein
MAIALEEKRNEGIQERLPADISKGKGFCSPAAARPEDLTKEIGKDRRSQ